MNVAEFSRYDLHPGVAAPRFSRDPVSSQPELLQTVATSCRGPANPPFPIRNEVSICVRPGHVVGFLAAPDTRFNNGEKYAKELEEAIRLVCRLRDRFNRLHTQKFGGEGVRGIFVRNRDGSIEALDACRTEASVYRRISSGAGAREGGAAGGGGDEDACGCGAAGVKKGCEVMRRWLRSSSGI